MIALKKAHVLEEQSTALVTCVLSDFDVLAPSFSERERVSRFVKGLDSLHVYANEYWLECLMNSSTPDNGIKDTSILFAVCRQLARQLSATIKVNEQSNSTPEAISGQLSDRLQNLQS